MKTSYNDIGIGSTLDRARIRKLMIIGLFGAVLTFIGDFILGWGAGDESLTGIERKLSQYLTLSDGQIFLSAILGFIGIPLEGLCYFSVYRLIAPYSMKHAHLYRAGIFGYLMFGGCGVHVPCLACVFFYKYMSAACPETALEDSMKFGLYFLLPGTVMLFIFFVIQSAAQISAFAKGLTPYPKHCVIFCLPVGMALTLLLKFFGDRPLANALTAAWISIGNLWMFGGLLITMKKARQNN